MNTPNLRRDARWIHVLIAILALLALALTGCSKEENVADDTPITSTSGTTRLLGEVVDENGDPVVGATVTTAGQTTTTDVAGFFFFGSVSSNERCVIQCINNGSFPSVLGTTAQLNGTTRVRLVLRSATPNFTNLNSSMVQDLVLPNGAQVSMPANALVNSAGIGHSGNYDLAVVHLDPSDPSFPGSVPGGDLAAVDALGNDLRLYSYGMLMIGLTDNNGNALQLAPGASATLTVPVSPDQLVSAPATLPMWHLDETTGIWAEEGSASLIGNHYVGSVGHFSTWNMDVPSERAEVTGRVFDCNNSPLEGIQVTIGQTKAITDPGGYYRSYVPSDLTFTVYVENNALGLASGPVTIPSLGAGSTHAVAPIVLACPGYIEGTIICNGLVNGYATATYSGGVLVADLSSNGVFRLAVPPNGASSTLRLFNAASGMEVTLNVTFPSVAGGVVQVGDHVLCNGQSQSGYQAGFVMTGDGQNGTTYQFNGSNITAIAAYSVGDNYTIGYVNDNGGNGQLVMEWPGSGTGTHFIDENSVGSFVILINGYVYSARAIDLNITTYGAVGSDVLGLFSGTLFRVDQITFQEIDVTVSNGYFRMLRTSDEP